MFRCRLHFSQYKNINKVLVYQIWFDRRAFPYFLVSSVSLTPKICTKNVMGWSRQATSRPLRATLTDAFRETQYLQTPTYQLEAADATHPPPPHTHTNIHIPTTTDPSHSPCLENTRQTKEKRDDRCVQNLQKKPSVSNRMITERLKDSCKSEF